MIQFGGGYDIFDYKNLNSGKAEKYVVVDSKWRIKYFVELEEK